MPSSSVPHTRPPDSSDCPRDVQVDNARGILVTLVVAGHLVEPYIYGSGLARTAYVLIYAFHIPGLVFLSGYLSHARPFRELVLKVTTSLLVPYLLFEVVYSVADFMLGDGESLTISVLTPYWLLWYLPALGAWRLILPLMSRLPRPLLVATGLALLAGTVPEIGTTFTASRFFVFLPAFLLGHRMASRGSLRDLLPRTHAWVILAACCLVAVAVAQDIDVRWLYGSRPYAALGSGPLDGMLFRLLLLVWSLSMAVAAATVTKARKGLMSRIGAVSMYPYVLHGLVVMVVVDLLPSELDTAYVVAPAILSVPLSILLSSRLAVGLFRPLLEPGRYGFIRRMSSASASSVSPSGVRRE